MAKILDSDYMDMELSMAYRFLDDKTVLTEFHEHNYYEYFIVTAGTIIHEVNGDIQNLKTGDMVFIRPSDNHRYSLNEDSHFKMINISFSVRHFENLQRYFESPVLDKMLLSPEPPVISLSQTQVTTLKKKHYLLNVSTDKSAHIIQLKTLLVDVMEHFITEYEQQSQNDSKKWLKSVLLQMNTPENIEEGLPALIRYSGFSHGHLCRIMKQEFGVTPTQYITNLRLQYAANLLSTTNYDILSISVRLGFSSLSHFITIFKEKFGITPSKYRTTYSSMLLWK